ncbi:MAG: NUDIX domain-containing protein [Candidatus Moraniibacteriota bacterium]
MRNHYQDYSFCPKCGKKYTQKNFDKPAVFFTCDTCRYRFFQNSKPSTAAIIGKKSNPYQILFAVRAREPQIGKLDLPGGFLDYGENPEIGMRREILEELGVDLKIEKLFTSEVADYAVDDKLHSTISLYFLTELLDLPPQNIDNAEATSCSFFDIRELINQKERFAFVTSDYLAIKKYLKYLESGK